MKNKLIYIGLFGFILAVALLITGCPEIDTSGGWDGIENVGRRMRVESGAPLITEHPTSVDFTGDTIPADFALRVVAQRMNPALPNMGELGTLITGNFTYQWFRADTFRNYGGEAIEGATSATFRPTAPGFYYVIVTNPAAPQFPRHSNPARVRTDQELTTPAATINITDTMRQYIRAFGGMSNGFEIGGAPGTAEVPVYMEYRDIQTMFNPQHSDYLGLKILRIHLFPAPLEDVLSGAYGGEDTGIGDGMFESNAQYVRFARSVSDHGGYVVAAPWTPPFPEWKTNNSLFGNGHLRVQHHRDYAMYLRTFLEDMARFGAPIYAVSIQNEPTYEASYYGMLWTGAEHRDFLADVGYVITGMNSDGTQRTVNPDGTPALWGGGVQGAGGGITGANLPEGRQRVRLQGASPHNDVTWNNPALASPAARRNLEIVAYHTYGSWNARYATSLDQEPRRETWMMEKNVNAGSMPAQLLDSTWNLIWVVMNEIHHVIAHNDSSVYTWWYLKRFYSMIGEDAFGTVNGEILPRGDGMAHFARYLTDTIRLETTSSGFTGVNVINLWNSSQNHAAMPRGIRAVAGMRTANPDRNDYHQAKLKSEEDLVTLVLMDCRINVPGESNEILINMPDGFEATAAHGIISCSEGRRREPVLVVLRDDNTAVVTLPSNAMVSLAFNGVWE
ncbi:MAG: hypothetical protein FWC97_01270 [Treponema sp.]|nr:hypothetical protein [Treponema sp.]